MMDVYFLLCFPKPCVKFQNNRTLIYKIRNLPENTKTEFNNSGKTLLIKNFPEKHFRTFNKIKNTQKPEIFTPNIPENI